MGQPLDLNQLSSSMKNLQEHGQRTNAKFNPETGQFEMPTSFDPINDGTPFNDAGAGKFYTKSKS